MRAAMARADADVAGANAARLVIFGAPEAIVPVGDRTGEAGKKAGVEWEEPVDPPKPKRPTPEEIAAKRSRLDARLRARRSSPTLMGLEQMGIGSAEARGWTSVQATAFEEQMVAHKYNLFAVSRMGRKKPPKTKCGPEEEMLQEGNEFLGKDKENDKAGDNRAIDDEKKDAAKDETGEPNGGGERAPGVELDVDDVPCLKCGETDGEPDFVLCDGCPKGGHYQCLGLPGVPEGDWFCADCVKDKETHLSPRKVPSADDFDEGTLGREAQGQDAARHGGLLLQQLAHQARHERRRRRQVRVRRRRRSARQAQVHRVRQAREDHQPGEGARAAGHRRLAREKAGAKTQEGRPEERRRTRVEEGGRAAQVHAEVRAVPEEDREDPRAVRAVEQTGVGQAVEAGDDRLGRGGGRRRRGGGRAREEETRVRRGDADAGVRKPAVPEGGRRVLGRRRVIGDGWTTRL